MRTGSALFVTIVALAAGVFVSDLAPSPRKRIRVQSEDVVPPAASGNGRYRELLARLEVPADATSYGKVNEWGFWQGTSYLGFADLPQGYWVYVEPCWYVWKTDTKPQEPHRGLIVSGGAGQPLVVRGQFGITMSGKRMGLVPTER